MKLKASAVSVLVVASAFVSAQAQTREPAMGNKPPKEAPAAQGYIPGKPSNNNQDPALKKLEKEEQEAYRPKPSPTPTSTPATKKK